jgi:type I restriction enzyme S subunit
MTSLDVTEMPRGWSVASIADIADINPKLAKTEIDDGLEVSFVPMSAVKAATGTIDVTDTRKFREVKKGYTQFQDGDVLFAKITPCMENGKMAVVPVLKNGLGFGSTEFHVLRPFDGINARYVYYFVSSQRFRHDAERNMAGAVGQQRVPTTYLVEHLIRLPPAQEQTRIVTKIEELFSKLDNGIASLQTVQTQLNFYKQAVLKHAFEGKLTAYWRKENKVRIEPPERLMARIVGERESQFQTQLDRWATALDRWENSGSRGKRPVKPRKHKDVQPIEDRTILDLPKLPENWMWVRLGQLTWSVKDGPHYSPKYQGQGIPFISGGNVRPEGIDFSTAKFISEELHEELSERCRPERGDVLYTKGGTTGVARVNTYGIDFNVWVHVAVLKIANSVDPFFLQHALNSHFCYIQAQRFTHGVGNQDLGLTRMVNIVLPICGTAEQHAVVSEVERLISEIDELRKTIDAELLKAESLRHSVLEDAFSGRLVTQNPSDEPAVVLLARIKGEKAARENGKTKIRGKDAA